MLVLDATLGLSDDELISKAAAIRAEWDRAHNSAIAKAIAALRSKAGASATKHAACEIHDWHETPSLIVSGPASVVCCKCGLRVRS